MLHTILVWAGIGLIFFALTSGAVIDVLRKDFGSMKIKITWGLVAMVPFIGWIIYLVFGFRMGKVLRK